MEKEGKKVLTKGRGRGILSELSDTAVDTEKELRKKLKKGIDKQLKIW